MTAEEKAELVKKLLKSASFTFRDVKNVCPILLFYISLLRPLSFVLEKGGLWKRDNKNAYCPTVVRPRKKIL